MSSDASVMPEGRSVVNGEGNNFAKGEAGTLTVELCKIWIDPASECTKEQRKEVIDLIEFAAITNDIVGKAFMGQLMLKGWHGVQKNEMQAFEYLREAADKGVIYAKERLIGFYYDRDSFTQAFALAKEVLTADAGNAVAHGYLGAMYHDGVDGVPADPFLATMHLKKSADAGSMNALSQYLNRLAVGVGCTANVQEALREAKLGYLSTKESSFAYQVHLFLEILNDKDADSWLELAAKEGAPDAQEELKKRQLNATRTAELAGTKSKLSQANTKIYIGEVTSVSTWSDTYVSGDKHHTKSEVIRHHKVFFNDQAGNTRDFDLGQFRVDFQEGNRICLVIGSIPDGVFDGILYVQNLSTQKVFSNRISTSASINWRRAFYLGLSLWAFMAILSYTTRLMHNSFFGFAIPAVSFSYWVYDLIKERIKRGVARPPIIENWLTDIRLGSKNIVNGYMFDSKANNAIELELVKISS